jgi:hypothetical protein
MVSLLLCARGCPAGAIRWGLGGSCGMSQFDSAEGGAAMSKVSVRGLESLRGAKENPKTDC